MTGVASITKTRTKAKSKAKAAEQNLRTQIFLVAATGILLVIGLAATLSASSVAAEARGDAWNAEFKQQALFAAIGLVVMVVAARTPYTLYRKLAIPLWLGSMVALIAVKWSPMGVWHGGAKRWLDVGAFEWQPSDFAKFAVIISLAMIYEKKERLKQLGQAGHFFVPTAVILGGVALLVVTQTDLGTTAVILGAGFGVMVAARIKLVHLGFLSAVGVMLAMLSVRTNEYQAARIEAWRNPSADLAGIAYHVSQSKIAIGSGGPFGVGLGQSRFRWLYLPNAHTDFIFSIIAEELGFGGAVFVILLFLGISVLGTAIAARAPDRFGMMVAAGITAWISLQAFINVGGVTGMIPLTGITLPFVSAGGSSLITTLGAVGVLLNIASKGVSGAKR
jgi:cell division protein FtsW